MRIVRAGRQASRGAAAPGGGSAQPGRWGGGEAVRGRASTSVPLTGACAVGEAVIPLAVKCFRGAAFTGRCFRWCASNLDHLFLLPSPSAP